MAKINTEWDFKFKLSSLLDQLVYVANVIPSTGFTNKHHNRKKIKSSFNIYFLVKQELCVILNLLKSVLINNIHLIVNISLTSKIYSVDLIEIGIAFKT